ncbi:hypothetical protein PG996_014489 [Apiospora saccharicola]|uniref:Nephrocystin 3-like N-terminal domain-containing protein n=1 Tax=Apiospora saccharicola TaxID=335842 RepID=A0ABR1TIF4_9PEZI
MGELNTYKASISMALEVDTNFEVGELRKELKKVEDPIITDKNLQIMVMRCLKPQAISPLDMHLENRRLREAGTCDWLFRSQIWEDWLQGGSADCCRFLFIHGIAGSGKTNLASAIIDQIIKTSAAKLRVEEQPRGRVGFSYYYCSHAHNVDETRSLLRWIVYDLSRQLDNYLPEALAHVGNGDDMSEETLLNCFFSISIKFQDRIYIVVDVIDEIQKPRERFLKTLTTIGSSREYSHISIIMTGRMEPDIGRAISASEKERQSLSQQASVRHEIDVREAARQSPLQNKRKSPENSSEPGKRICMGHNQANRAYDQSPTRRPSYSRDSGSDTKGLDNSDHTPRHSATDTAWMKPPADDSLPTFAASKRWSCSTLDMDNGHSREAIRLFVRKKLGEVQSVHNWDRAFTKEVEGKLTQNAGGMFRLASCQIDVLQQQNRFNLYNEKVIRDAVETMPDTVFDVYKKIVARYFAQTKESNEILELQIAWLGLGHWGKDRPAGAARIPTRFEEWCLKTTEKSLTTSRSIICFPIWVQIMQPGNVYQKDGNPADENTSILVSLMLLDWPELAKKFLGSLTLRDRNAMWQDEFALAPKLKDLPTASDLVFRPQMTILKPWGDQAGSDKTATFDDGATTNLLLDCLLEAGADPCPPGYRFTPLQLVISHLDERWVHTMIHGLQHRNRNINTIGDPDGAHPFTNSAGDDGVERGWWYVEHPLDICQEVIPEWGGDPSREDEVEQTRTRIRLMLRQYDAFRGHEKQSRGSRGAGIVVNTIIIDE